jgi:hypothetical protein
MAFDEARLRRLLGGSELTDLRRRLRARYERGAARGEFTLVGLEAGERRALSGLLGRPIVTADSMRLCHAELDAASYKSLRMLTFVVRFTTVWWRRTMTDLFLICA